MKKKTVLLAIVCALILSGCANENNSEQSILSTSETSQSQTSSDVLSDISAKSSGEITSADLETSAEGSVEEGPEPDDPADIPKINFAEESKEESTVQTVLSQYFFKCIDENGNPVSGAKLQVCTEEACFMLVSDDNGTAVFDGNPFAYSVHVSAPEGYEIVSEKEFTTLTEYSEYTIEFKSI